MQRLNILGILALTCWVGPLSPADGQETSVPSIVRSQHYQAARASSTYMTGANRDSIALPPGQTVTLADLEGPGIITHCWFTLTGDDPHYLSKLILKMWWDDADTPAVESPWGPFFGLGHNECADVASAPLVIMAATAPYIETPPGRAAFNCYFAMPFRQRARMAVTNTADTPIQAFFYHIDYQRHDRLPDDVHYFHACYRTEHTQPAPSAGGLNTTGAENYVILDTRGTGHYVGCTLHVRAHQREEGKWYEGDDMIFVDGQPFERAILGTGSEDYFGMAWGARRWFQSPYCGTSYHRWHEDEPDMHQYGLFSLYRFHLPDPIPFTRSIRVTIEHGHDNDAANRYASVAYWYARQP